MSGIRFQSCDRKSWNMLILAAALIAGFLAGACDNCWARAEQEPNDRYEQANSIGLDEEISGFFDTYDEPGDRFKIVFPGPGTATFTLYGYPSDCAIQFTTREWVKVNNLAGPHYLSTPGSSTFRVEFTVPADKANKDFLFGINPAYSRYAGGFARYDYRITQCSKGGPFYYQPPRNGQPRDGPPKETSTLITYRFKVSFNAAGGEQRPPIGAQQVQPPVQPPITTLPPPPPPDNLTQEITLAPGNAWEGTLPAGNVLELLARIGGDRVAGGNFALEVSVNGQRLAAPLANKGQSFRFADGRTFPYYDASASGWLVFYSPDFTANNTAAGGGYQVLTDPGQAYRYRWDISSLAANSQTVRVRLYNNGRTSNMPVIVRLAQSVVALPPPPPQVGKTLRVLIQDQQGRPVAGTPARVGVAQCSAEGTTDASGTAVLRLPPGCP